MNLEEMSLDVWENEGGATATAKVVTRDQPDSHMQTPITLKDEIDCITVQKYLND